MLNLHEDNNRCVYKGERIVVLLHLSFKLRIEHIVNLTIPRWDFTQRYYICAFYSHPIPFEIKFFNNFLINGQ